MTRTPLTPYVELGFKVEDVVKKKAEELRQRDLQEDAAMKESLVQAQASRDQELKKKEQALAAEVVEVQSAESDLRGLVEQIEDKLMKKQLVDRLNQRCDEFEDGKRSVKSTLRFLAESKGKVCSSRQQEKEHASVLKAMKVQSKAVRVKQAHKSVSSGSDSDADDLDAGSDKQDSGEEESEEEEMDLCAGLTLKGVVSKKLVKPKSYLHEVRVRIKGGSIDLAEVNNDDTMLSRARQQAQLEVSRLARDHNAADGALTL